MTEPSTVASSLDAAAAAASSHTGQPSPVLLFPTHKIKAALYTQQDMGMLRKPVVDLISACSAVFVQDLLQAARQSQPNNNNSSRENVMITLQDLQPVVQNCSLLQGVLDGLQEGVHAALAPPTRKRRAALPKPASSKRTKAATSKDVSAEALELAQQHAFLPNPVGVLTKQVIPDEDEYD